MRDFPRLLRAHADAITEQRCYQHEGPEDMRDAADYIEELKFLIVSLTDAIEMLEDRG